MAEVNVPAFPVRNLHFVQGSSISLPQSTPHPVYVLESWATWCPPCRQTIPHLNSLAQQFQNRGVVFVGITSENDEAKIKQFVAGMGNNMKYPVALDKNHEMDAYARHFQAQGIPHAYLVDCMGVVRWHGHPAEPSMANKIDVLANERAAKVASAASAAEETTTVPPSELTFAILKSLSMSDVKWALTHNHMDPSNYLEKPEMLDALFQANKVQATKLRGKIALSGATQAAKTEEKAAAAKPATSLAGLTSEKVAAMSVSELKRIIHEHNIAVPAGDVEKADLVKAIVSVL